MAIFPRPLEVERLRSRLSSNPIVAILGPRQSGKTTLVRTLKAAHYFDLERPTDLAQLETPELTLSPLRGTVVIDEIQRRPELFPVLRHLVDTGPRGRRFVVLGSASPDLLRQSSESLAGRISYLEVQGFRPTEAPAKFLPKLWLRGGFPRSLFAQNDLNSLQWRLDYISTFLERDVPALGITVGHATLRRFWSMLAHNHGGILNISELGGSFGVSDTAVRHYLEILESTFMITLLRPWSENISKRQVKRPKVYFRDSGIFHAFLNIRTQKELLGHIKLGASWEGYVVHSLIREFTRAGREFYFWGTHGGAELDLLMFDGSKRIGFEVKFSDAPTLTESMKSAMETLKLDELRVIYPGTSRYRIHKNAEVLGLMDALANTP